MKAVFLKVASQQRTNPATTTPSNFILPIQGMQSLKGKWRLMEAHITNSVYTVDSRNNTVYFNENSTNKTATIASGFYNASSFATAVATAMTTASGGYNTYSASVGSATQQLTLSASNAFSLTFGSNTSNSAALLMGFTLSNTASATSQTGTGMIALGQTQSFNIDVTGANTMVRDATTNAYTLIIPNAVDSQSVNHYAPQPQYVQYIELGDGVSALQVVVRDDKQNVLSLNGVDFWFVLQRMD